MFFHHGHPGVPNQNGHSLPSGWVASIDNVFALVFRPRVHIMASQYRNKMASKHIPRCALSQQMPHQELKTNVLISFSLPRQLAAHTCKCGSFKRTFISERTQWSRHRTTAFLVLPVILVKHQASNVDTTGTQCFRFKVGLRRGSWWSGWWGLADCKSQGPAFALARHDGASATSRRWPMGNLPGNFSFKKFHLFLSCT